MLQRAPPLVALQVEGFHSVAELAVRFGVSRKTAYKWVDRYREAVTSEIEPFGVTYGPGAILTNRSAGDLPGCRSRCQRRPHNLRVMRWPPYVQ